MNESPLKSFFRNRWVLSIIFLDVLILATIIVLFIMKLLKTSVLTLNVAPLDAKILVNGSEYHNGSFSLKPGAYRIEISHTDLDSKIFNINLEADHNSTISAFLKANGNDFSYYSLKENHSSFLKLEEIASVDNNQTFDKDTSADTFITSFQKNYDALSKILPIEHQEYTNTDNGRELVKDITIKRNYDEDCKTSLCLKAMMIGTEDKEFVKLLLQEKGLKAEDYEIYYKIY